jgi:hypothetical protein
LKKGELTQLKEGKSERRVYLELLKCTGARPGVVWMGAGKYEILKGTGELDKTQDFDKRHWKDF